MTDPRTIGYGHCHMMPPDDEPDLEWLETDEKLLDSDEIRELIQCVAIGHETHTAIRALSERIERRIGERHEL